MPREGAQVEGFCCREGCPRRRLYWRSRQKCWLDDYLRHRSMERGGFATRCEETIVRIGPWGQEGRATVGVDGCIVDALMSGGPLGNRWNRGGF